MQTHLDEERAHLESVAAELRTLLGKEESRAEVQRGLTKLEYFEVFRAYRMFEQNLLNHRLTWGLAIHGFLFATYGFSLQKLAELEANPMFTAQVQRSQGVLQLKVLLGAIPLVGLCLSLIVLCGVIGAKTVLKNLEDEWDTKIKDKFPEPYLPDPAGGGLKKAIFLGYIPPYLIPLVFAFAWLIIFIRYIFML